MKKILTFLFIIAFLTTQAYPLYAYTQIPEYLCEMGLKFYQQGRYDEAVQEFKKALMLQPNYEPALKYMQMIQQMKGLIEKKEVVPPSFKPTAPTSAGAIKELLDLIEIQREMILERQLVQSEIITPLPKAVELPRVEVIPEKKISPPKILNLDESIKNIQPIEVEQDQSIIIIGKNIQRFLVTYPDVLTVEKKSADELLVTGNDFGYTQLHIWDEQDRWTLELLTVPAKPEGPTYEEMLRISATTPGTFKLRYSLDWSTYELGRRINKLNRQSYYYNHTLSLFGETPYGNLDSTASIRTLRQDTDLTYFTLGLRSGKFGPFEDFHLRTFDYSPPVANLAMPGTSLRGVMLESAALDKKVDYTLFWGREGGGRYGNLSPGLAKTRHSFLSGLDLDWDPSQKQNYGFSIIHGWGRDRAQYLNSYAYDLNMNWQFDKLNLGYEVGYDSESLANLLNLNYSVPKLNLSAQLRDVSKKYLSIIGQGWQIGQFGGLLNLSYKPTDNLNMSSRLDIFQDQLFPASDNDDRWNQNFDWDTTYTIDPLTSLGVDYSFRNELGRVSQYRSYNEGISLNKTFEFIKKINTFASYRRQESTHFTSPAFDIINDKISVGLGFNLIGDLHYYLNKEFNWLRERYEDNYTQPEALETGIDWNRQIFQSPFYGNLRCNYRNEKDTASPLSFLSGEDYLEGYAEVSYRPMPEKEIYCSTRVRNVWAENPTANKRVEADFRAGMRYLWDTGVHWESVGNIEGYVFKDLNSDGLRQRDEAPVEGVKLWAGKDKSQITDIFGYYKFKGIRARKAYVTVETSTLPSGFVLTVPVIQETNIAHNRTVRLDFGIITRSEISGLVFEDVDGNGQYSKDDKGVQGVTIVLETGKKAITDATGRYYFPTVSTGEHTVTLDLNSLPIYYLPKAALKKEITLFEGVTYIYNIPLKKIKE